MPFTFSKKQVSPFVGNKMEAPHNKVQVIRNGFRGYGGSSLQGLPEKRGDMKRLPPNPKKPPLNSFRPPPKLTPIAKIEMR